MREKLNVTKSTGSNMVPMTMAKGLPMMQRESPEAAGRGVSVCHEG